MWAVCFQALVRVTKGYLGNWWKLHKIRVRVCQGSSPMWVVLPHQWTRKRLRIQVACAKGPHDRSLSLTRRIEPRPKSSRYSIERTSNSLQITAASLRQMCPAFHSSPWQTQGDTDIWRWEWNHSVTSLALLCSLRVASLNSTDAPTEQGCRSVG